jgi:hypothetical protein
MMSHRFTPLALAAIAVALMLPSAAGAKKVPRGFYGVVPQGGLGGADYQRLAGAKVGTMRVEFNWPAIQPSPGNCTKDGGACNWGAIDDLAGNLAAAGVRLRPVLYGSPPFVSKHHNKAPTGGKDLKKWRAFVRAAVGRYGRGGTYWRQYDPYVGARKSKPVRDWQFWNEPNSKQFWHGRPKPRRYGRLLKASSKQVRKKDRKADVALAGMYGFAKQPLVSYLRELYRVKKIERAFKAIAIHPYSRNIGGIKKQIRSARRAARRAGDRKVRIQMTEMGWTSSTGAHPLDKGKKGQASMLKKSFRLLTRKRRAWNIDGIVWFAYNDTNLETCQFCRNAGLVNVSGQPKPAWRAFTRFTK